ncbi:mitochondrial enolase superfamily member 1 [Grus japonensis]|uniref:Mitochondrial enolase superfamily member 1 n=1 Tax=Grus japonensis TaxID=30415 RepID=A0ABC9WDY4_GRUJA
MKGNSKVFYRYMNSKRKTRENASLLLSRPGDLVTKDIEKAKVLSAFFVSAFTSMTGFQQSQVPKTDGKAWSKEDLPSVEEDLVRQYLSKLDPHKSTGPDGMHPQVLKELADVIVRPLLIIFERSWQLGEVPQDWKKVSVTVSFQRDNKDDLGKYRLVSLTSIPGNTVKQIILEIISKHIEQKKVIESIQHGFMKGKSCLTDLMLFYNKVTSSMDQRRTADFVYRDFNKAFGTVSCNILINKLEKYRLDKWTVRWSEDWLNCQVQSVVISSTKFSWRPVTSGVPQG